MAAAGISYAGVNASGDALAQIGANTAINSYSGRAGDILVRARNQSTQEALAVSAGLAFGGALVETENPAALAEAIEEMVKNPDRRKKAGVAGQHHINTNFSLKKQAERLKAILNSAQR